MTPTASTGATAPRDRPASAARERILEAAYDLFSHQGVRAVGIDAIIERSGVARMTLYRHFASKDALVLAFLERREERWTKEWLQGEVERRSAAPGERLLAIFDVFDEWFQRSDFEGCSFVNVLLEISDPADQLHRDQFITSATWTALAKTYNERQLMDAIFTVGQYTMVSMFLNSASVQLEPGVVGVPK